MANVAKSGGVEISFHAVTCIECGHVAQVKRDAFGMATSWACSECRRIQAVRIDAWHKATWTSPQTDSEPVRNCDRSPLERLARRIVPMSTKVKRCAACNGKLTTANQSTANAEFHTICMDEGVNVTLTKDYTQGQIAGTWMDRDSDVIRLSRQ